MSARPGDLRAGQTGSLQVTIFTRPGCHLCEEARAVIEPLVREFGCTLLELKIDEDGELQERYGLDIPVIFIGARKAAKHRVNPRQFRRQLEEAQARR